MLYVDLIGRLGKDSEVKVSKTGNEYLEFTVANDTWNPQTKQNDTQWYTVRYSVGNAKTLANSLKKGYQVSIHGTMTVSTGTSRTNGQPIAFLDIMAHRIDFVYSGKREDNNNASTGQFGVPQQQQMQFAPQQAPQMAQQPQVAPAPQPQYQAQAMPQFGQPMPQMQQAPQMVQQPQVAPAPQPQRNVQQMIQQPQQPQYQAQQMGQMPFPSQATQAGDDLPF